MKEFIDISMKSVKDKINENRRSNCFEIFGYDFILDSNFNLYLLEINTNPGIEESSPLINKICPRMIDDALRLTIDDLFDTKYSWEQGDYNYVKPNERRYNSPYPIDNYNNQENVFTFVCNLNEKPAKI